MAGTFSVGTINVRGLRDNAKRRAVFDFLESERLLICFLQEVHLKDRGEITRFSVGNGLGGVSLECWGGSLFRSGDFVWEQRGEGGVKVKRHFFWEGTKVYVFRLCGFCFVF